MTQSSPSPAPKPELHPVYAKALETGRYTVHVSTYFQTHCNSVYDRAVGKQYIGDIKFSVWEYSESIIIGQIWAYQSQFNVDRDDLPDWAEFFNPSVVEAFEWLANTEECNFDSHFIENFTYVDVVLLRPEWQGYGLGITALAAFLDAINSSFVFLKPCPMSSPKSKATLKKLIRKIRDHWMQLGFKKYDRKSNYLWMNGWECPSRFQVKMSLGASGGGFSMSDFKELKHLDPSVDYLNELEEWEEEELGLGDEEEFSEVERLYNKAARGLDEGLWLEALVAIDQAIAIDPEFGRGALYALKGDLEIAIFKTDDAIASASRAIELDPKDAMSYMVKAKAYYRRANHDDASDEQKTQDLAEFRNYLNLSITAFKDQYQSASSEFFMSLYRWVSENELSRFLTGADSVLFVEDAALTAKEFYAKAEAYLKQGTIPLAFYYNEQAIDKDPLLENGDPYVLKSKLLSCMNCPAEAAMAAEQAISIDPSNPRGYSFRAVAIYEGWQQGAFPVGHLSQCRQDLEKAVELFQKEGNTAMVRGIKEHAASWFPMILFPWDKQRKRDKSLPTK